MKKILGMGNALTDILLQIESNTILDKLNLPIASMQLIGFEKMLEISNNLIHLIPKMATGGSASNTINGITKLGVSAGFVGKIGRDAIGDFFMNDSINNGVTPHLLYSNTPSGQCTVLVSPDGERTLCSFLGAASELVADDINADVFQGYDIFHIEGYLVQNHDLIRKAVRLAKESGLLISIDLASYNVVDAHIEFLNEIIQAYVDIVFANEEEARAYTEKEPMEALIHIADHCDIAIVKIGKDGSFVKSGKEQVRIQPILANCIDTTGAGDLYAAGFLYGLACNYSIELCGQIGSIVSAKVVEVLGAKMTDEIWTQIHVEINKLIKK